MLPENACEGIPLNYDYYAIDIANRPQSINFAIRLSELHEQYRNVSACTSFLGMTVCLAEFPPCSADNNRLQEICESGCSRYGSLLLECVTNIIETTGDIDFDEINQINNMFNCSNPETYLPGVSGSLYDTEENCHDLYDVDNGGKHLLSEDFIIYLCSIVLYNMHAMIYLGITICLQHSII